ncbi:MAG: hypothetical protein R3E86_19955 [Pseudomonadales bacterium]
MQEPNQTKLEADHAQAGGTRIFLGRSPREAIAKARAVFGRDAVIIEQRRRGATVEIVASRDFPEPAQTTVAAATGGPAGTGAVASAGDRPGAGPTDPTRAGAPGAAEADTAAQGQSAQEPTVPGATDGVTGLMRQRLESLGFEPDFINRLDAPYGWRDLTLLLERQLRFARQVTPLTGAYRMVGAPGCGKTTTLIKLLAEHVLRYGRHGVQLISTDNRRLAGCEQLAEAAQLLNVPCLELAEDELPDALQTYRGSSLVLVDSAGVTAAQPAPVAADCRDVLVLPATWQPGALRRLRSRLGGQPAAVALTHVDHADVLGPCLSVLAEWQLPLAWLSRGPELPDDLERATPELLGELLASGIDRSQMSATFA